MEVKKYPLQPLYIKDNGMAVFAIDPSKLPIPFQVNYQVVVTLPPEQFGGNHKHPRQEAFIGTEELEIMWLDSNGDKHIEKMGDGETRFLFVVPSYVPHVIRNTSQTNVAQLIEFADGEQHDVERASVL